MRFEGILPPVITPFAADGALDRAAYATVIEQMLDKGVHGIIVGGTTGEFYALSREERVAQIDHARDVIAGRVPLICGVNDISTEGACAYAVAAREAGADALLVAAPYYSLPTQNELAEHCEAIDEAGGLPIILYNYPGRTGVPMDAAFLRRLSARPNVQCIKESSGDINRIHMLVREFPDIQLSCGAEDQALEFFAWGATSWVTPMGNFFPAEIVAFYDACMRDQDFAKARRLMTALLALGTVLEAGGQLIQCTKLACETLGLPGGPVRRPLGPLDPEAADSLRAVVLEAKAAIAAILSEDAPRQAQSA